jgi:hypothetical protein
VLFFVSALAETNRPPFDLPEAESELVAGYQVEYSSTPFLLFMAGEYIAIFLMCALMTLLFFGGWLSPIPGLPDGALWMVAKMALFFFLFAMVKAVVPRYRYDQLMRHRLEGVPAALARLGGDRGLPREIRSVRRRSTPAGLLEADQMLHDADRLWTRATKYFLLQDIAEGLRPRAEVLLRAQGHDELPAREGPAFPRASAASTRCAAIPTARNAASPASSARRSAPRRPSPSTPNRARTAAAAPRATTST